MPVTADRPRGELIQVVAVEVGDASAEVTAVDSGGVNHYQDGGGRWSGPLSKGHFLATTSPQEHTNAGLRAGATITLTYSKRDVWQAAIAECVPGVETRSGSADNKAGGSPQSGTGTLVSVTPSSHLLSMNEPLFVATILKGRRADTWTESPGYKTLFTLQGDNTLTLAYQIIPGRRPMPYLAVSSAPRVWSASNRSYKTAPPP